MRKKLLFFALTTSLSVLARLSHKIADPRAIEHQRRDSRNGARREKPERRRPNATVTILNLQTGYTTSDNNRRRGDLTASNSSLQVITNYPPRPGSMSKSPTPSFRYSMSTSIWSALSPLRL